MGSHISRPQNPKRYANDADPVLPPVGEPPSNLTPEQDQAWRDMAFDMPWLRRSDRCLLELTCRLIARMKTDPDMGIAALAQVRLCLSSMGATPVDRGKVKMPDAGAYDPADEFLN